jgi:xylulokinase
MKFLGIDIGTSNTKGLIVEDTGNIICRASATHQVHSTKPGWAEQDADTAWWAGTIQVIRSLLSNLEVNKEAIAGIGVSGLFPALLLVDERGTPLRPAILYSDNRASKELKDFNDHFNLGVSNDAIPPKLAWLRTNEPDIFRRSRRYFSSHNYIIYRLTGSYCLDYKVADAMGGFLDRSHLVWSNAVASWVGIKTEHLPTLCSEVEIVGSVTETVAQATGLRTGTPVIAGSGDSLVILVSSGAIEQGDAMLSFGTSGWMGVVPHRLEDYLNNPLLIKDGSPYSLECYLLALGSALKWYVEEFGPKDKVSAEREGFPDFKLFDKLASEVPIGSDGMIILPYFAGTRNIMGPEPKAGAIYGVTFTHTTKHIYRALLESFGYIVRAALENLQSRDVHVKHIVSTGGGASSDLWRQIVSDIIGRPLTYYDGVDPCLGNAYLVGYALSYWDSLNGITRWLPSAIVTKPSEDAHARYEQYYHSFQSLKSLLSISAT